MATERSTSLCSTSQCTLTASRCTLHADSAQVCTPTRPALAVLPLHACLHATSLLALRLTSDGLQLLPTHPCGLKSQARTLSTALHRHTCTGRAVLCNAAALAATHAHTPAMPHPKLITVHRTCSVILELHFCPLCMSFCTRASCSSHKHILFPYLAQLFARLPTHPYSYAR